MKKKLCNISLLIWPVSSDLAMLYDESNNTITYHYIIISINWSIYQSVQPPISTYESWGQEFRNILLHTKHVSVPKPLLNLYHHLILPASLSMLLLTPYLVGMLGIRKKLVQCDRVLGGKGNSTTWGWEGRGQSMPALAGLSQAVRFITRTKGTAWRGLGSQCMM